MTYDALAERLATDESEPRIVALPDGSVDTYYDAFDERGDRIPTRDAFADRLASEDHEAVPIEPTARESGGQAVNMAKQARALGAETVCYGHLDDPVFEDLAMETHSMGEPSRISIFAFDDADRLLAERSADVRGWSLRILEAAAGAASAKDTLDAARDALDADAICCGNWASVDGLTDAIEDLAAGPLAAGAFVLDPGAVSGRSDEAVWDLLDALAELDERTDVAYSVNRAELEGTVEAIESASGHDRTVRENLRRVREAAGIAAVVLHEVDLAAAATRDGVIVVEALDVADPQRRTGAGDRFSAGLAVGRVRGWDWETTLALGNACAAYAVETAATGTRNELRAFVERKTS
ncbi:PfkB family carbohydrate kinase [Halovivax limisalsi]|uniref:PfkB family carbohydrate kinase n=1 Tax=Halovivax limisalsi TaxID=1453760 RepID=UPI001FFD0BF2|nr:PfkB family carbohydrate kinase [Halovivax limisalsi]